MSADPVQKPPSPNAPSLVVRSPADGTHVASVTAASAADVDATARRLRAAQPGWEALGVEGRARHVARLRDWMVANADHIAEVLRSETGKSHGDALVDGALAVEVANYYLTRAEGFLADEHPRPHSPLVAAKRLTVTYRPRPLVGVISPWNFPVAISFADAFPALLAGCAVLIKPSELTPLAVAEIVGAWRTLGGPDVLDMVNGDGSAGTALVDACDYVQFTGSAATGTRVMQRAAETLTPVSLELGGKDPMIVLADADLERAANAATWGGMFNSGQACVAVERVYVEAPVYDEFLALLARKVGALRQGAGADADLGAMATPAQLDLVERHVDDAVQQGATVLVGGHRVAGPGLYFEPTVLTGVTHDMLCMRDESFGPTLPVMMVRDAEEAIALANDSGYGLSASVWSRDTERAEAIARRIECGAVNVNDVTNNLFAPSIPHSGWKTSGIGSRSGGAAGIRKYCRPSAITVTRVAPRTELIWYPHSARRVGLIRRVLRLVGGRGRGRLR
jgi:acyl-CoA reductase-like NAD-dependent aldehyde dehydrogenase